MKNIDEFLGVESMPEEGLLIPASLVTAVMVLQDGGHHKLLAGLDTDMLDGLVVAPNNCDINTAK